MTSLVAHVEARIRGTHNNWSLARNDSEGVLCRMVLAIQGDPAAGYHLIKSPEGFFTADNWYETLEEALDDARDVYGVARDAWRDESE